MQALWVLLLDPENMAQFIESRGVDTMIKICKIKFKHRDDTLQVGAGPGHGCSTV